ncbi:alpha/beta fold hydrolase [Aliidiomarina celeris]|uniref:alpha/beta fold hydrolase n=1 Tax=Aliidiomarina celeris TaxID=2249428 RepID=UPI000DEAF554|nr:alpha/beta fold hydrolase [Aliidiomarina celeris]
MQCVALHSSQSHGGQWRGLAKILSPSSPPFSSPDLIGYGGSEAFKGNAADFRFEHEFAHLRRLNIEPERGPYVLVGHSYGGALALYWARCFPKAVKALVLYEPVAFHVLPELHPARTEIVAVAEAMEQMNSAEACAHFVDYWNSPGYFQALPTAAQALMIEQQAKVTADFHALLDTPATLADYQKVDVPVYLFSGQQSPLSSRTVAALLAEQLPQVVHQTLDAGHMGPITKPRLVLPVLLKALEAAL